ncbi:MAG: leucine-rich repeat domain-containing protein [Prevotella sp.]|nr:leucine-rich repeat domain-containing protein [Prevotella sp.]
MKIFNPTQTIMLTAALLLFGCLPIGAQTDYGFFVAGVPVTSSNAHNIQVTDESDNYVQGVSYEPLTNTLVLNNATIISRQTPEDFGQPCINASNKSLTIKLIGVNNLIGQYIPILCEDRLEIVSGEADAGNRPTLNITCVDTRLDMYGIDMYKSRPLESYNAELIINGCDVDINTTHSCISGYYNPGGSSNPYPPVYVDISIENGGTLKAHTTNSQGVFKNVANLSYDSAITMPLNVSFSSSLMAFTDDGVTPFYPISIRITGTIAFQDSKVEQICLQNWDENEDNKLDYIEARLVTSLGNKFRGNKQITRFPELRYFKGLEQIDGDFADCSNLCEVLLPPSLKTIGMSSFFWCALQEITIPRNVKTISGSAFYNNEQLQKVVFEANSNLETIGDLAFASCNLTSLTLPSKLKTIDSQAFYGNNELCELSIPAMVTSIGEEAFMQGTPRSSITKIVMEGSTPPTLAHDALGGTDATIAGCLTPSTIIYVTPYYLDLYKQRCPQYSPYMQARQTYNMWIAGQQLAEDNLDEDGAFSYNDGRNIVGGVWYNRQNGQLTLKNAYIKTAEAYTPAIWVSWGELNIKVEGENYVISDDYIAIQSDNDVNISTTNSYYYHKPKLIISGHNVGIDNDNVNVGWTNSITIKNIDAVIYCDNGPAVRGATRESYYDEETGFQEEAGDPAEFYFDNSKVFMQSPRHYVFERVGSVNLKGCRVVNPANVSYITYSANDMLTWHPGNVIDEVRIGNWIEFQDENVEALCLENWDGNHDGGLDEWEASRVYDLGNVFTGNTEIKSFDELSYFTGLSEIGDNAFKDCENLEYVSFPDNDYLWRVGDYAFYYCPGMIVYNMPPTVTEIGDYAFTGSLMENISLGKNVKHVGDYAFSGCMGAFFSEESQLETIGKGAFYGATDVNLIPASVKSIGDYAFCGYEDQWLSIDVLSHTPAQVGVNVFGDLMEGSVIRVPMGTASIYKSAWAEYKDYIVGEFDSDATAIKTVKSVEAGKQGVFTLDGRRLRKEASTDGLPRGLYIVNGKKVTVK